MTSSHNRTAPLAQSIRIIVHAAAIASPISHCGAWCILPLTTDSSRHVSLTVISPTSPTYLSRVCRGQPLHWGAGDLPAHVCVCMYTSPNGRPEVTATCGRRHKQSCHRLTGVCPAVWFVNLSRAHSARQEREKPQPADRADAATGSVVTSRLSQGRELQAVQ